MSSNNVFNGSSALAASGTTTKAVVYLAGHATRKTSVLEFSISFQGTDSSHAPVLCKFCRLSVAPSGGTTIAIDASTFGGSMFDTEQSESIGLTMKGHCSDAGTISGTLWSEVVSPNGGGYTWSAGATGPIEIPRGGKVALIVDTPANTNPVIGSIKGSEH